ncbi:hypothetical protein [Arthrobacter sp. M4]|uniref:hypothetical protein n=1 Tax=Arthrobacter sp. M4 TaxID=218160 RepID=UPI001CDC1689|nr:hypothetical protein [Arthrobacter sp. M4]MCA4134769.1 hypothetical protein [Arthrobacter sp. M4]
MSRRWPLAVVVPVAVCCVTACAGSDSQALMKPVEEVSSAAQATILAVELRTHGRTTAAAATTLAGDMLDEVEAATKDVASKEARSDGERGSQSEVLAAFAAVSTGILHARDAVGADSAKELDGVRAELRDASDRLGGLRERLARESRE